MASSCCQSIPAAHRHPRPTAGNADVSGKIKKKRERKEKKQKKGEREGDQTYRSRGRAAPSEAPQPRKLTTSSASDRRPCALPTWTPEPLSTRSAPPTTTTTTLLSPFPRRRIKSKRQRPHNPARPLAGLISPRVIPQKDKSRPSS